MSVSQNLRNGWTGKYLYFNRVSNKSFYPTNVVRIQERNHCFPFLHHFRRKNSYVESEDTLNEIKDMLSSYFAQKAEKEIDKLWDSGQIDNTVVEGWKHEHMRTY